MLQADIIYLNTGGVIKGKIIESDDSAITVRTKHGETELSRDDIDRIEECESVSQLYYDKLDKLPEKDAEAHYKLARWLDKINEPELANDEYDKTIILDPDHSGARSKLGYIKKGNAWIKKDSPPRQSRIKVNKRDKQDSQNVPDEHNLLSGTSDDARKAIKKLDSPLKSEREEALKTLAGLHKYGDVQAVQEYMRYREARLIVSLQQMEGGILNLLHGQLDEDLRERQTRWFERFREAGSMRERLHSWKTLDLLLKEELSQLKKLSKQDCEKILESHKNKLVFLEETSSWLKSKDVITTEFGSCLTDVYFALLNVRAGKVKKSQEFTEKLEPFDKYLYRIVTSWHLESKSGLLCTEMMGFINSLRESKGLSKLRIDENASKAAMSHARDMYVNEFFSHTSPTFGTPLFRLQRNFALKPGWKSETEGELISKHSSLPSAVFNEWMGKEKDKLLNKDWTAAGIACLDNLWVVVFLK